eukprot:3495750-Rhodomonas_salina.1
MCPSGSAWDRWGPFGSADQLFRLTCADIDRPRHHQSESGRKRNMRDGDSSVRLLSDIAPRCHGQ